MLARRRGGWHGAIASPRHPGVPSRLRLYLVDVIGQPSLSAGATPPVRGEGYGKWLLLIGERDPIFPHARSEKRARADLPGLQEVILLADHGHGVETSLEATRHLQRILGR